MDQGIARELTRYGGMIAAILGLIWMIWQMSQKGQPIPEKSDVIKNQKKFLGIVWGVILIPVVLILILISRTPGGVGIRGAYFSLLIGCIVPPFIASLESQVLKKIQGSESVSLTTFSSIPMAAIGISLLFIGTAISFYGIRAESIWLYYIIGSGLGLFLVRLASNLVMSCRYEQAASKLEAVFLLVASVLAATILAGYHFEKTPVKVYMPTLVLMGLFLSVLLSTIPFNIKAGKKVMNVLPGQLAVFLALFLGICLFLILKMNFSFEYNFPIIAGSITSIIFIVLLFGSSSSISGVDLSAGPLALLLLVGGIWFSFKWGKGFGMSLYSVGVLAVTAVLIPYKSLETFVIQKKQGEKNTETPLSEDDVLLTGKTEKAKEKKKENKPDKPAKKNKGKKIIEESLNAYDVDVDRSLTWARVFLRGITIAGLATLLISLSRIFIQKSPLLTTGIDISYGDNLIAFILGVFVTLAFEGFNMFGGNIFLPKKQESFRKGLFLFTGSIIVGLAVLFSVGVFYRIEGVGAFVTGLAIPALLGVYGYFSTKQDKGLYRASLSPLWVALAAYTSFIIKYKDVPDQMTRTHKQQILFGMVLLIFVIFFLAHYKNRDLNKDEPKEDKKEEEPVEKDLKVKGI